MTLEQAIEAVHDAGYSVRNLFERQAGGWQANLGVLAGKTYSEFGIADTPAGALLEALHGAPILSAYDPATSSGYVELPPAPPAPPKRTSLFD